MKIDTLTMTPHAEIITRLGRAVSLVIWIDGVPYAGEAELVLDEGTREAVLSFKTVALAKPKKKAA